jgi:RNA polymerase sigma-70 factor (ECF subfamily)
MEESEAKEATELVSRIRSGDPAAEAELVHRYGPRVMRMLQSLTRNRWSAEDVHQETFATALQRLRRRGIDEPAALAQFLRQTARYLLISGWRKARRRGEVEENLAIDHPDPDPGQLSHVLRREQCERVQRAVASVRPLRYRQLLTRYYFDGEAKDRICADLGLDSAHFNRVLFRARRSFLDILERQEKLGHGSRRVR